MSDNQPTLPYYKFLPNFNSSVPDGYVGGVGRGFAILDKRCYFNDYKVLLVLQLVQK